MLRRANAIVALLIVLFFCAHEVLGALYLHDIVAEGTAWLVWVGIVAMVVHVALCIATTKQMLDDEKRPPSRRKKAHQAKKWVTGIVLSALVVLHALIPDADAMWAVSTIILAVALAVHVCVSSKSLVKDLGLPSGYRFIPRVFIVAITLGCAIAVSLP